ncbi:uncharacterized protein N7515_008317 [Penicillium bovifimosum]|uniref:FHA domain-containing protein n=1 Tax=Penicillium bovifimosum TaxID=126998 RepID=A0A9W9GN23_9EURO|nr:uncharacterized protein N7515_008317 [Penicillium bovifimosum]KAJ5124492.1 hypothetical protein N7515_008317 [Penicillium bovifimosum]
MSDQEVTVTLLPLFTDTHLPRTIDLTKDDMTIAIGRSSKREGRKRNPENANAWFESRVMSRDHALLTYSPEEKMVFICDCGSTHGTFVNDAKLVPNVDSPLFSGDIIRFGVSVDRGHEVFEALEVRCSILWPEPNVAVISDQDVTIQPDPSPSTNSFSVPEDDSDVESADVSSSDGSDGSADRSWETTITPTSLVFSCKDGEHGKGEDECSENEPIVMEYDISTKPTGETGAHPMPIPTVVPSLPSPLSDTNPVSEVEVSATKPVSDVDFPPKKPTDSDEAWAAEVQYEEPSFPESCYQGVPELQYSNWTIMKPMFMRIADMAWGQSNNIPDVDHEKRIIHAARRCSFSTDAYWVDDAPRFRPTHGTEISWEPDSEESDTSFHRMPGSLLRYWSVDKRRFWVIHENQWDHQMSNWWWVVEKPQELLSDELKHQLATETEVDDCHKYWIVRAWEPQLIGETWCDVAPYWDPCFDTDLLADDESVDSDEDLDSEYSEEYGVSRVGFNDGAIHEACYAAEKKDGENNEDDEAISEGFYTKDYPATDDEDDDYEDEDPEEDAVSDGSKSDADRSSDDGIIEECEMLQRVHMLPPFNLERHEYTDAVEVSKHVPETAESEQQGPKIRTKCGFNFVPPEPFMTYPGARFPKYSVSTELPKSCQHGFPDSGMSSFPSGYKTVYHDGPFASNAFVEQLDSGNLDEATSGKSPLKRTATEMESSVVPDVSQDAQRLPEDPSSLPNLDKLTSEAKEAIGSALAENVSATAANDYPAKRVKHSHSTAKTLASHAVTAAVGLVLGGVGTIAALAAMPNKYFQ